MSFVIGGIRGGTIGGYIKYLILTQTQSYSDSAGRTTFKDMSCIYFYLFFIYVKKNFFFANDEKLSQGQLQLKQHLEKLEINVHMRSRELNRG